MRLVLSILYNTILRGTIVHRAVTAAMVRKNLSLWLNRAMVGAAYETYASRRTALPPTRRSLSLVFTSIRNKKPNLATRRRSRHRNQRRRRAADQISGRLSDRPPILRAAFELTNNLRSEQMGDSAPVGFAI